MSTALTLLQGFNNDYLQTLTTDQLNAALDMAWLEIEPSVYGTTANAAAANLAAHELLMENIASSAASGGQSGQALPLVERRLGKRTEKYGSGGSSSGSSGSDSDDPGLEQTIYGQRFKRMRKAVSIGTFVTGGSF